MPLPMPSDSPPESVGARYPATTKQAAAIIAGIQTDATCILFTDKIMITIAQDGRVAQWVKPPISTTHVLADWKC